jgi:hypothetical protein
MIQSSSHGILDSWPSSASCDHKLVQRPFLNRCFLIAIHHGRVQRHYDAASTTTTARLRACRFVSVTLSLPKNNAVSRRRYGRHRDDGCRPPPPPPYPARGKRRVRRFVDNGNPTIDGVDEVVVHDGIDVNGARG